MAQGNLNIRVEISDEERQALKETMAKLNEELNDAMYQQSVQSTVNMLMAYDAPKEFSDFVSMTSMTWKAAVVWAITHGYVDLTDKGRATPEVEAAQQASLSVALGDDDCGPGSKPGEVVKAGGYL